MGDESGTLESKIAGLTKRADTLQQEQEHLKTAKNIHLKNYVNSFLHTCAGGLATAGLGYGWNQTDEQGFIVGTIVGTGYLTRSVIDLYRTERKNHSAKAAIRSNAQELSEVEEELRGYQRIKSEA